MDKLKMAPLYTLWQEKAFKHWSYDVIMPQNIVDCASKRYRSARFVPISWDLGSESGAFGF